MSKRKKLTRTEIAMNNAERQFRLERAAIEFALQATMVTDGGQPLASWTIHRARAVLLETSVSYWRGVQR